MKLAVADPVEAARLFGGATWEPGVGWWTYTTKAIPKGMAVASVERRDAIYVPTRDRNGEELDSSLIFSFR